MNDFKKKIYRTEIETQVVQLDPFDYMIVTYQYRFDDYTRDLDSATAFNNTGVAAIEDRFVGCGQPGTPAVPTGGNMNTSYLFFGGDDVGNGKGESVVINFKNLWDAAPVGLANQVEVELYAGWCLHAPQVSGDVANVSVTTYKGGTMSTVNNVIVSTGTVIDSFQSTNFPVIAGCCGVTPSTGKTHVGTIHYNYITKVASVNFY